MVDALAGKKGTQRLLHRATRKNEHGLLPFFRLNFRGTRMAGARASHFKTFGPFKTGRRENLDDAMLLL